MSRSSQLWSLLAIATMTACATPTESVSQTGTSQGPDLSGFVTTGDIDLGSDDLGADLGAPNDMGAPTDLATPHDLATPVDLASAPDLAMSGCGSVTYAGSCTGNTLTYCDNDTVQTLSCTSPTQCTVVGGDADCRYVAGSACGNVTAGGLCGGADGDTLVYCSGSELVVTDCEAQGQSCVKIGSYADCF